MSAQEMKTEGSPAVAELVQDDAHWIAGKWSVGGGETIEVRDPCDQEVLARVPRGTAAAVDEAVDAAASAFASWRGSNPAERGALLHRWADLCEENEKYLRSLEEREVGAVRKGRYMVPTRIRYFASLADKVHGTTLPVADARTLGISLREPFGVCGAIVPWNVPALSMVGAAAPALAAGNTMVVKPAEVAPLVTLYLARLASKAGVPPGVLNVVNGYGSEVGAALAGHRSLRHMTFTGSPTTGASVMKACADNSVPVLLELGGKSAHVLLEDVDVERAVESIVANIISMAGQACSAGSRVVVARRRAAELVDALAVALGAVTVGPISSGAAMGPLVNAKQGERVLRYIADGKAEGATLVQGGKRLRGGAYDGGFYVEPTLFADVTPNMRIAQEEIFGPVLCVLSYEDVDEAIEIANGTRFGLVGSVWSRDVAHAFELAQRLEAGQVAVNGWGAEGVLAAPFGGYKGSGFGRTRSIDTLYAYTQTKTVTVR